MIKIDKNFSQIYIHIPFCVKKCNYCAFNSKTFSENEVENYISALETEIKNFQTEDRIDTIYFGGGTPSILKINQLEKIFNSIQKKFTVEKNSEITIEVNPSTVDEKIFRELKNLGFNRLSIGVQSFDDNLLKILGRIHDSKTAIETVKTAEKFFQNISVDLMYALPNQTLKNLADDLKIISELNIQHISIYGLEIEEGTNFFARRNFLNLPSDDLISEMYDFITEKIPALLFERYEISNFAKKNFESRHNTGYWTGKKYFGFGAGAHSFTKNFRTSNEKNISTYIKKIRAGEKVSEIEEILTEKSAMEEFCFLGLRMTAGISVKKFFETFGKNIFEIYGEVLKKYFALELLRFDGDKIFFTPRGFKVSNIILSDFLL